MNPHDSLSGLTLDAMTPGLYHSPRRMLECLYVARTHHSRKHKSTLP